MGKLNLENQKGAIEFRLPSKPEELVKAKANA